MLLLITQIVNMQSYENYNFLCCTIKYVPSNKVNTHNPKQQSLITPKSTYYYAQSYILDDLMVMWMFTT